MLCAAVLTARAVSLAYVDPECEDLWYDVRSKAQVEGELWEDIRLAYPYLIDSRSNVIIGGESHPVSTRESARITESPDSG